MDLSSEAGLSPSRSVSSHSRSQIPVSSSSPSKPRRFEQRTRRTNRSPSPSRKISMTDEPSWNSTGSTSNADLMQNTHTSRDGNDSRNSELVHQSARPPTHASTSLDTGGSSTTVAETSVFRQREERSRKRERESIATKQDGSTQPRRTRPPTSSGSTSASSASVIAHHVSSSGSTNSTAGSAKRHAANIPHTPSRTQLRHVRAVRRLSQEAQSDPSCDELFKLVSEAAQGKGYRDSLTDGLLDRPTKHASDKGKEPFISSDDVALTATNSQAAESDPSSLGQSEPYSTSSSSTIAVITNSIIGDSFTPSSRVQTQGPCTPTTTPPSSPPPRTSTPQSCLSESFESTSTTTTPPNSPPARHPHKRVQHKDLGEGSSRIPISISLAPLFAKSKKSLSNKCSSSISSSKSGSNSVAESRASLFLSNIFASQPIRLRGLGDGTLASHIPENEKEMTANREVPVLKECLARNNVDVMADSIDFDGTSSSFTIDTFWL